MMKTTLVFLSVFVLLGVVSSSDPHKYLPPLCHGVETKCKTQAALHIFVTEEGKCEGKATASCKAAAVAYSCVKKDYKVELVDHCSNEEVEGYAKCYAKAGAASITKTLAYIKCDGTRNKGCSYAKSEATARACSFALSLVQVLLVNIKGYKPTCLAKVGALAQLYVEAVSKSTSLACTKGGSDYDSDYDAAVAFQSAVTKAWASCWTKCDKIEKPHKPVTPVKPVKPVKPVAPSPKLEAEKQKTGADGYGTVDIDEFEHTFGDGASTNFSPFTHHG